MAGEINFSGLFDSISGANVSDQRKVEEKLETNLKSFRSIASSQVIIPVSEVSRIESLWGMSEARVLPVEVILKLKKRRRMLQNEYKSIMNLVSSSLSEKNIVVQPVIRDEEGFEWSEDGAEAKEYFKATALENEIWERLQAGWSKTVQWSKINVSEKDGACKIEGSFESHDFDPNLKLRREIMSLLGDLCTAARLTLSPTANAVNTASSYDFYLWLERAAYVLLGFALWGLGFAVLKWRTPPKSLEVQADEDAIILTKMVDRNPDEAAKWMVRAMLLDSSTGQEQEKNSKPQDFDQSL